MSELSDPRNPAAKPIVFAQSRTRPYSIERTEQSTFQSRAGRVYEVSVAFPKSPAPQSGYPVFYVLDPNTSFTTLTEMARNHERILGPSVVVGIGYLSDAEGINRNFDMSPPTDPATLPYSPDELGAVGGADPFLAFIQEELKPAIEKRVSVDKSREALFGHSLGGLFVLHVLFASPEAFNTYIAGSPSIWWGNKQILQELPRFKERQTKSAKRRRLLIAVGELESGVAAEERRWMASMADDPEQRRQKANLVGNAAALADDLQPLSSHGLQVMFTLFPDETHNSIIPAYLSRGARFALSGWFDEQVAELDVGVKLKENPLR